VIPDGGGGAVVDELDWLDVHDAAGARSSGRPAAVTSTTPVNGSCSERRDSGVGFSLTRPNRYSTSLKSLPTTLLQNCYQVTSAHTHPFNGPFSRTTRVSRYQKGETNLDFTEARDSEWQWHQLGHM